MVTNHDYKDLVYRLFTKLRFGVLEEGGWSPQVSD